MVNNLFGSIVRSATDVQAYNPVNTLIYALLFAGLVFFIYDGIIKRFRIKMDKQFAFGAGAWAFFAMSLRLLWDTGYTESVLFITPYVTVIDFGSALGVLLLALYIQKTRKIEYWKTWGYSGAILGVILLSLSPLQNWKPFGAVVVLWLAALLVLIGARKVFPRFMSWWNIAVLEAHMMDAAGSFAGITFFGFSEEHVLGRSLITYAESLGLTLFGSGAWVMFLLKIVVLVPVLYYIDKYSEDAQEAKYLKTIIFVLGLAIGLRNGFNILIMGP